MRGIAKEFFGSVVAKYGRVAAFMLAVLWVVVVALTFVGSFNKIPIFVMIGYFSQDILRIVLIALLASSPIWVFFLFRERRATSGILVLGTKLLMLTAIGFIFGFVFRIEDISPYNTNITYSQFETEVYPDFSGRLDCHSLEAIEDACRGYTPPKRYALGNVFQADGKSWCIAQITSLKRVARLSDFLWRTKIVTESCDVDVVDVAATADAKIHYPRDVWLSIDKCNTVN